MSPIKQLDLDVRCFAQGHIGCLATAEWYASPDPLPTHFLSSIRDFEPMHCFSASFSNIEATTNPHSCFYRAVSNQTDLLRSPSITLEVSHQALPALNPAIPEGLSENIRATYCLDPDSHIGIFAISFQSSYNFHTEPAFQFSICINLHKHTFPWKLFIFKTDLNTIFRK